MERFADALDRRGQEPARRVSSQNGMPLTVANRIEATPPALFAAGITPDSRARDTRSGVQACSGLQHWCSVSRSSITESFFAATPLNDGQVCHWTLGILSP